MRLVLIFTALLLATPAFAEEFKGQMIVLDGDSLRTKDGTDIRIYGIDAPEMRTHPQMAWHAKMKLDDYIQDFTIRCITVEKDSHGRWVAVCNRQNDTTDAAMHMLSHGYATTYRIFADRKPDLMTFYIEIERQARQHCKGLWAGVGSCK